MKVGRLLALATATTLLWQLAGGRSARCDVILLKSGGELRGELQPAERAGTAAETGGPLTIRTVTGAVVSVEQDEIESIVRRRAVIEDYETLRRACDETALAHWELSEWCRERNLSKQRATHLERVVEIDPLHAAAHRGLGHIRHEGRWTTTDEMMTARGYVKHKGRYVLPEELALIHEGEREDEAEKSWFRKVRLWSGWLDADRPDRQANGLNELRAIDDPDAVPALVRTFKDDANEQKRLLMVDVLSRMDGDKPLKPLVQQSLRDDSKLVREAAVRGVRGKNLAAALSIYLRALKNEANVIVNRAGHALGMLGDAEAVVPLLIEALVTRHRYKVMVPDQSIAMGTDGSMASGVVPLPPEIYNMLITGQLPYGVQVNGVPVRMKQVIIQKNEDNPSVLAALNLLTGEDLGFDEQRWHNWHKARVSGKAKPPKKPKPTK